MNSTGKALDFCEKFASLWAKYGKVTMASARKANPDNNKHRDEQRSWIICKKWAKEFYEQRSSFVHNGDKEELSSNWSVQQHLLLAAFSFPLSVKLLLEKEGQYQLSKTDKSWCHVFEELLNRWDPRAEDPSVNDENWDEYNRPSWSNIVTSEEAQRGIEEILCQAPDTHRL